MEHDRREAPPGASLHDLRAALARLYYQPHTPTEHLSNVRELGRLEKLIRDLLAAEVAASRKPAAGQRGRSWYDVALVLDVWPSSAHERFSPKRPKVPANPPPSLF